MLGLSLSESRQPESSRFTQQWPGMPPRHSESFPGQPCAKAGTQTAKRALEIAAAGGHNMLMM
jgi:hypothetical protein